MPRPDSDKRSNTSDGNQTSAGKADLPAAVSTDPGTDGGKPARVTREQVVRGLAPDAPISDAPKPTRMASWRAILLGFLLLPFFDYWVLDMEVRTSSVEPTD